ncbi:MAG: CHASE domain-containing protein [Pseudomonadaceae bacterium]|nr:CHASE domain-containing protein [Pseudomonadaceae bacterium]
MSSLEKRLSQLPRRMPLVVLLCGLLATVGAWYGLRASQQAAAELHFQQLADEVVAAIEKRMNNHRQILLGAAGLFEASDLVTRQDWRHYVQGLDLDASYPGIQGLGFSQVIRPEQLADFEADVRREGFADFTVRPPGPRDLYTSILFLEPFSGRNLAAFGFDMYSEPIRRAAMRQAAQMGKAQLSGKVTLLQETAGPVQAGLLMYVPVYRSGLPLSNEKERLEALRGFVYSPYRVSDLMSGILDGRKLQIDFALFSDSKVDHQQQLFVSDPRVESGSAALSQATLQLFGQTWTLAFYAQPGFFARFHQGQEILLLLGGIISVLLFFLTRTLAQGQQQALALASEMTVQLRSSEVRLQRVLKGGHDGWWDLDVPSASFYASPRTWQMLGYPEEGPQPPFSDWTQMVNPDDLPGLQGLLQPSAGETEKYLNHECRLLTHDGHSLPVLIRALIQYSSDGQMMRASGTAMDLSEQKRIEQLKSDFVSTVSHELRTPLTSISGSLGLVNGGALGVVPEIMRPMLEIAQQNSQRLSHLINDLLDMDKLAAGKLSFELSNLALAAELEEAVSCNQSYASQHQIVLQLDPIPALQVRADALRMQQVLANFLSNAIKFSSAGGQVRLHATLRDGRVRVSVTDQGSGIPEHFRSHIFHKFSQAESGDQRQKGGTGLGLAISKELIERMGGLIGFDSQEGHGSTFWFELPVLLASRPAPDLQRPTILVVEDEADIALLLQMLLQGAGYRVLLAHSLAEARELLELESVAAITLDLRLPDGNGVEFIQELHRDVTFRELPILVISVASEQGQLSLQGGLHVVEWLDKPIDPARLLSGLRRALSGMHEKPRILHVEDDADLRGVIAEQGRHLAEFIGVATLNEARQRLSAGSLDLVLLDLNLPDGNGLELIEEIHQLCPGLPIVVLSSTELSTEQLSRVEAALAKSRTEVQDFLDILARLLPTKENGNA